jgi:hypothetical protein
MEPLSPAQHTVVILAGPAIEPKSFNHGTLNPRDRCSRLVFSRAADRTGRSEVNCQERMGRPSSIFVKHPGPHGESPRSQRQVSDRHVMLGLSARHCETQVLVRQPMGAGKARARQKRQSECTA